MSVAYETRDAKAKPLFIVGFGLLGLVIVVMVILYGMLMLMQAAEPARPDRTPSALAEPDALPPEPRLQIAPAQELARLLAREDSILASYGWVDEAKGIARMPIDSAIDLLVRKGMPPEQGAPSRRTNHQH